MRISDWSSDVCSSDLPALRGLNPSQRAKTVSGAFRIEPKDRARFTDRTVLLIDDVYTSGATANGCARVLKRAGAAQVHLLCWRSEEHTSELQSLMRLSYAVFCLKKKTTN